MENVIDSDTTGKYRKQNPDYAKVRYLYRKAVSNGNDTKTIKQLKYTMENLPSSDRYDPNFRRVRYVRYADDCAPRKRVHATGTVAVLYKR